MPGRRNMVIFYILFQVEPKGVVLR